MRSFCRTFPAPLISPISPISHLPYLLLRWCMVVHMQSWNYLQEENLKSGIKSINKWHLKAGLKVQRSCGKFSVCTYVHSLSILENMRGALPQNPQICQKTQHLWQDTNFMKIVKIWLSRIYEDFCLQNLLFN